MRCCPYRARGSLSLTAGITPFLTAANIWHGTAVRAQIHRTFGPGGRPELERQYREAFAQLKDRPGEIHYAWLRCGGHTQESWRGAEIP